MLRTMVCAAVLLVLVGGVSLAEKKKINVVDGKIVKYDQGCLWVAIKKNKDDEGTTIAFKITKNTKVTGIKGLDDKLDSTGGKGHRGRDFNKNTPVRVKYIDRLGGLEGDVYIATSVQAGGTRDKTGAARPEAPPLIVQDLRSLARPEVADKLGLSAGQRRQVRGILANLPASEGQLRSMIKLQNEEEEIETSLAKRNNRLKNLTAELAERRALALKQLEAVLTPGQKAAFRRIMAKASKAPELFRNP
jgi:hypothetical protein